MTINLTDPANHPANSPLTGERIERVIEALESSLKYRNGSSMDHVLADAVKGLRELRESREDEMVFPDEMTISDDMNLYQKSFAQGHNACRAAMLQGAEQETTAYKLPFEQWLSQQTGTIDVECGCVMTEVFFHWLRVAYEAGNSPVTPDGWCLACRSVTMSDMRFVVCPDCGNKRCPRANDHNNACTGSNELGQIGSAYPTAPQEVK